MKAGFFQLDFTPSEGFMPGEGLPFWATGVRVPLFVNAAAFGGEETVILVSVDQLHFDRKYVVSMRQRITEETGVPGSHILIAATHSHTGASVHEFDSGAPGDKMIADHTNDCVVKAAVEAYRSMKEGYCIGYGKGIEDRISFNRDCIMDDGRIISIPGASFANKIVAYLGEVDHDVHVMRVNDPDGNPAAFLVNYANHPDNDNTKRNRFSSDYPGALREYLKIFYGKELTVLFFNGACGDVNAFNYKSGLKEKYARSSTYMPEEMGKLLTETVCNIDRSIKVNESSPEIKAAIRTDSYNKRVPTEQELCNAAEDKELLNRGEYLSIAKRMKLEIVESYDPEGPKTMDVELQAVRIGEWTLFSVPGELYTDIGLAIKAIAPKKKLIVSTLTNGSEGYIAPDNVLGSGAYGGMYYSGKLGYGTKDKMVFAAEALLKELG